jgi:lysophospholipase L1-like esterase
LPVLLVAAALTASCSHDGPAAPTPGEPLAIVCPVDQTVNDVTNAPTVAVTFAAPRTTGGQAPLTVQCNPASGTNFALGQTPVSCGATDTGGHFASCAFNVTVARVPMLSATSFITFGDSLTEGEVEPQGLVRPPLDVDTAHGYPAVLARLLTDRYTSQTITLLNAGYGGERLEDGFYRLRETLTTYHPEVVLLFEGINDLNGNADYDEIPHIVNGLRDDIRESIAQGVRAVLVSTLTPQRDPSPGYPNRHFVEDGLIRDTNSEIADMARREGAILVDGYSAIAGDVATLVGADGLHLTIAGYQALANAFFMAIEQNLEVVPAAGPAGARGALR